MRLPTRTIQGVQVLRLGKVRIRGFKFQFRALGVDFQNLGLGFQGFGSTKRLQGFIRL